MMIVLDNLKMRHIHILLWAVGSLICLFSARVVRGQNVEALNEKGSFQLRPKTTFQHYCAPCHGEMAQGDGRYFGSDLQPPPRDLTDAEYMNRKTDEELIASISGGTASIGKSNLCPPWEKTLGRERIEGLVRYLRNLSRPLTVQDASPSPPLPKEGMEGVETISPLRLAILIAMSLTLLGAGGVQWRKLRANRCL